MPVESAKVERRVLTVAAGVELRSNAKGEPMLAGYAAVFDTLSKPVRGAFRERVARGAFARAIREGQDVVATANHDANHVMGRVGPGTLRLREDDHGLHFEADLPRTTYAKDLQVLVERGDVTGASFMFLVAPGGETWDLGASAEDGLDVRTLTDVDLYDVSVCTFPMYDDTKVALRSWDTWRGEAMPEARSRKLGLIGGGSMPDLKTGTEADWSRRNPGESRSCYWSHLGLYAMHGETLQQMAVLAANNVLPRVDARRNDDDDPGYRLTDQGIAVVRLEGPMKKARSKFGGTSTVEARKQIRDAAESVSVRGIMLHVESPGGHVEGTKELADEVKAAAKLKPVHAFIDGMGASAAMWVACQAARISANPTAQVGSIGVLAVMHDVSGNFEKHGIKVHVVASGSMKGAGTPGTPVTEEHLAEVGEYVGAVWSMFRAAVVSGRQLSESQVAAISGGEVWVAAKAKALGLIDAVGTYEAAMARLEEVSGHAPGQSLETARRRQRQAEAQMASSTIGAGLVDELHVGADGELADVLAGSSGPRAGGLALLETLAAQDFEDDEETTEDLDDDASAEEPEDDEDLDDDASAEEPGDDDEDLDDDTSAEEPEDDEDLDDDAGAEEPSDDDEDLDDDAGAEEPSDDDEDLDDDAGAEEPSDDDEDDDEEPETPLAKRKRLLRESLDRTE